MTNFQKYLFVSFVVAGVVIGSVVFATSKDDIVYPVAQLGNCANQQACFAYCEDSINLDECLAFAEQHNLLSSRELEKAKKFRDLGAVGPGGCENERACETYCENISNIEECLDFAQEHDFIEPQELNEARKVAKALREGAQLPGGCQNKRQCEAFCENPNNMRQCIDFAEKAGFMSPQELKEARKMIKAFDAGLTTPGNCQGKNECEAYCENGAHIEECIEFGVAAGFIPPEEVEIARRVGPLMARGETPGQCKSKEQCEAYCSNDAHIEECITFFEGTGAISREEVEMFRKTGGKGPGGCQGRQECEAFCNNPANQQACFEFGRSHGLIPEHELRNIEEGTRRFKEGVSSAPPEVAQCLANRIGQSKLNEIQAGTLLPGPKVGEHMRDCFEEFAQRERAVREQEARGCFALDCESAITCFENLPRQEFGGFGGSEGGDHEDGGDFDQPQGFEREIEEKLRSCFQELEGGEGRDFFPGDFENGNLPDRERFEGSFDGIDPSEIERRIQEEQFRIQHEEEQRIQRQFQEEFKQGSEFAPDNFFQEGFQQFEQLPPRAEQDNVQKQEEFERQRRIEEEQRQQQEAARRAQIEHELQQQFQQREQFQEDQSTAPPVGGSVLDALLFFVGQLLPK